MMRRGGTWQDVLLLAALLCSGGAKAGSHGATKHDGAGKATVKPQVVLLFEAQSEDEAVRGRLSAQVQRGMRQKRVSAEPVDVSVAAPGDRWPLVQTCAGSECQAELCQRNELRQLWSMRVVRDGDDYTVRGQIYDAAMADFASEVESTCVACDAEKLSARLLSVTGELAHKAQQRKTGLLEITSIPPGATVRLNGMRLGQTPLTVTTFAGEHRIEVTKPGFARYLNEVVVEPGRGAAHDALLVIEPGTSQGGSESPRAELSPRVQGAATLLATHP